MSRTQIHTETVDNEVYHKVKDLPDYKDLQAEVKKIVAEASYWERWGCNLVPIGAAIPLHAVRIC